MTTQVAKQKNKPPVRALRYDISYKRFQRRGTNGVLVVG